MKKLVLVAALVAALFSAAFAQDINSAPPVTAHLNVLQSVPQRPVVKGQSLPPWPFCKKSCLYYAGDFDSTDSNADGLLNANDTGLVYEGATWVGVKPPNTVTVTGVTFNEFFSIGFVGTNPAPFQTQVGITEGNAGTTVCKTTGNATLKVYGESYNGFTQYGFTVKKLAKACQVQAGSKGATYVNLQPQSANGYAYTANVEDAKPKGHYGWKNDLNDCYFDSATFGLNYVTCDSQGIGSNGFSEFSIALTGK